MHFSKKTEQKYALCLDYRLISDVKDIVNGIFHENVNFCKMKNLWIVLNNKKKSEDSSFLFNTDSNLKV